MCIWLFSIKEDYRRSRTRGNLSLTGGTLRRTEWKKRLLAPSLETDQARLSRRLGGNSVASGASESPPLPNWEASLSAKRTGRRQLLPATLLQTDQRQQRRVYIRRGAHYCRSRGSQGEGRLGPAVACHAVTKTCAPSALPWPGPTLPLTEKSIPVISGGFVPL